MKFKQQKLIISDHSLLINNLSHSSFILLISSLRSDFLFFRIETQITFLEVPQALPNAFFDSTKTQGTFYIINKEFTFYSHRIGKCKTISKGLASAAIIMSSVISLFNVFVASLAPFFNCFRDAHWATKSTMSEAIYSVARG